jgi:hypothetical protein
MRKFVFIYILFISTVFANTYDDLLLKTQISIFPKIGILDKNIDAKLINEKIIYTIVYEKDDFNIAKNIKTHTENIFFNGLIDTYSYKINLVEFESVDSDIKSTIFYVLNASKKKIKKISDIAIKNDIITFSYDISNLYNGILFSLAMEKSTVFYLNKETLAKEDINFATPLLRMVKFIIGNDVIE